MAGAERKLSTIIFLFTFFKNKFTISPTLTLEMPFSLAALLSVLERGLNVILVHILVDVP